jgi:hypothetical protein
MTGSQFRPLEDVIIPCRGQNLSRHLLEFFTFIFTVQNLIRLTEITGTSFFGAPVFYVLFAC